MPEEPNIRVLALDPGKARIGVAVGETGSGSATPLCVIERKGRDADVRAIGELCRREGAGLIVMGLPQKNEGELGPGAEAAMRLGKRLARALSLPVEYVDEFESTAEAHAAMIEAGMGRARRAAKVDQAAAAVILRRWLAGRKAGS